VDITFERESRLIMSMIYGNDLPIHESTLTTTNTLDGITVK